MAFVWDPNLEEEDKNQESMNEAPSIASGSGAQTDLASNGSAQTSSGPTSSGSYQNLNDYINANQGSGFGNQFVGKVSGDVDAANQAQNQAANQFKQKSDQSTVKYDNDVVSSAINDPYSFSQDQNKVNAFQNQLNAKYTGPQSLRDDTSSFNQAAGATKKAEDVTRAAQTEPGRFSLLNNYFGRPEYNQGQQSLDNLLIQGDQGTGQALQQAKQNADQSRMNLQNKEQELQKYAAGNLATTAKTAADVRANTTAAEKAAQDQINANYQAALDRFNSTAVADKNKLASLNLGNDLLSRYGLSSGMQTFGANPADFYDIGMNPTLQNVTDKNLANKYNAYTKLLGENNSFLDPNSVTGDFKSTPTFDANRFNSQIATNKQNYLSGLAKLGKEFSQKNGFGGSSLFQQGLRTTAGGPLTSLRGSDAYFNAMNGANQEDMFNKVYGNDYHINPIDFQGQPGTLFKGGPTDQTDERAYVESVKKLRDQYGYNKKLS